MLLIGDLAVSLYIMLSVEPREENYVGEYWDYKGWWPCLETVMQILHIMLGGGGLCEETVRNGTHHQ